MKTTYTHEQWTAMSMEEKKNAVAKAKADMRPVLLPSTVDQGECAGIMSELKAYCCVQYAYAF